MKCAVAIAIVAGGCDPLVDGSYTGRPLFTLDGTLSEATRPHEVDAKLALLWQDPETAGGPGIVAQAIPYALAAPNSFSADVPAKPPNAAWFAFDDGGPRLGEAYVHLVTHVPVTTSDFDLGLDQLHVLVYAADDVVGGSASEYLGGDVTAGYHLRLFTATTTPGPAQRELIDRCIANTGDPIACERRRAYRLDPVDDATPLRIISRVR